MDELINELAVADELAEGEGEEIAEVDHDGYVLPLAEGVTVAVTDALAVALALPVSLCAYTEERHKSARIWNILLLLKKEVVCFYINFMG